MKTYKKSKDNERHLWIDLGREECFDFLESERKETYRSSTEVLIDKNKDRN